MTTLPIIETARLRIRPFTPDDLDHAHQLYIAIDWVDDAQTPQPPTGDRVVELKVTSQFIGACGCASLWLPMRQLPSFGGQHNSLVQPEVALMWAILPELWGNGYAPEMARALIDALFARFKLRHIVATTEFDNAASQRVMEKVGMRLERNPFPDPFWFQVIGIIENPRKG
ncbi:MAG: GNAT family N-acetyltransferase [Anaerolineae bacterium]